MYDFIISDMWYPLYSGGADHGSGDELIKNLQLQRIAIPVIICSTIQYNYAGSSNVIGAVQCQDSLDWETVLEQLLKSVII
ncbi:hypothetical protein [Pseudobutyrivibrio ruminis]|uniref:hypothetical protein n=1 Tax=Pseudobutyrivibrio ruminis TaxID=46206 RepID=UPI00051C09D3|nr:hypothetical protein [Pseudobutyrivibrio ruminis]